MQNNIGEVRVRRHCVTLRGNVKSQQRIFYSSRHRCLSSRVRLIQSSFGFSNAPEVNTSDVQEYVEEFRVNSTKFAQSVVEKKTSTIFSVSCFMHTDFERGSPTVDGMDYYDMLYLAANAVLHGTSLPESKVDTCNTIPCGTHCKPFP